jgi:hypothetical protein
MAILIVLGAESPIPCKILPRTITSKLVAFTQTKLATIKRAKPMYTTGFLPTLSESGPKTNGPNPRPRKIIVISSWLSTISSVPIVIPIISNAGNNASIANATTDIKDAISATNSNWEVSISFCIRQKYGIALVSSLFYGTPRILIYTCKAWSFRNELKII